MVNDKVTTVTDPKKTLKPHKRFLNKYYFYSTLRKIVPMIKFAKIKGLVAAV